MQITGTHIAYYFVCHRKLWLFTNGIQMEHVSEKVDEGRLVHETSYSNRSDFYSEIEIDGVKIDFYDPKTNTIHETKLSPRLEISHVWQLRYYLFKLKEHGIKAAKGILEYPKLREIKTVFLSREDEEKLKAVIEEIPVITSSDKCPSKLKISFCKNCSYFDFCWSDENID